MSPRAHDPNATGNGPKTVVIGVGNLLLKDEGVGIHVIQALQELPPPAEGEFALVDGGTCPDAFDLLPAGIDKLIVVDAVKGGGEPGDIYRFTPDDIAFRRRPVTSLHQLGLEEGLRLMAQAGRAPGEVVIIGVEPKEIDWGLEMSPELEKRFPQIVDLVRREFSS